MGSLWLARRSASRAVSSGTPAIHRGRLTGKAMRGNTITYGDFGLVATEPAWITSNQIEAARIAMTRYTKRGGQVWIKIFPDKPITERASRATSSETPAISNMTRPGLTTATQYSGEPLPEPMRVSAGFSVMGGFNRGPRPEKKEGGAQ